MNYNDDQSGNGKNDLSRRDFVATGIKAGFAAAVYPLSAFTLTTDTIGLVAGDVSIESFDRKIPAYWAMPVGKGPFPSVIVVHEIFGVHEHIKDLCRRFAKKGFLAIAPYLYSRQGEVVSLKDIPEIIKVVSKVERAQVTKDLDATMTYIEKSGKADMKRVSITGFCWGGATTWLYAANHPKIKAGAAWYGPLQAKTEGAESPLSIAATLKVPVLGLYGGQDANIPQDQVHEMETSLKKGSSGSKIIVYPDSPHGFNADYRESYRKKDADAAWSEMLSWFKKHHAS